jgi:hypothetical protein
LVIAGDPTEHNMALYVSALIDLGTQHQALFNFEAAIEIYNKIRDYAEEYPHLFLAALRKKENEQHVLPFQGDNLTDNMEENDGSDSSTSAVPSYALPQTAEESVLVHLGYAFEALMLLTRDKELETIRQEIKQSHGEKLGEHKVFNDIRERLQDVRI